RRHCVVASGGLFTPGAARLAARGALRAGAGLATIASPRAALAVHAAANLAVMVRPADGAPALPALLADPRRDVVLLGPAMGLGRPSCRLCRRPSRARHGWFRGGIGSRMAARRSRADREGGAHSRGPPGSAAAGSAGSLPAVAASTVRSLQPHLAGPG